MSNSKPPRPAANSLPKGSPLPPPVDPLIARAGGARGTTARQGATRPVVSTTARTAAGTTAGSAKARPSAATTAAPSTPSATRTPVVGRRAKPARSAKMVSLGLSAVSTVALAGLFARQDVSADDGSSIAIATPATTGSTATTATTVSTTGSTSATTATTATPATTATTPAAAATSIVDGTYLGGASQNRWGTVQVQAVYSGGQLVDVQILQYPNGDRRSVSINQRALPSLINAAISAQSANVSNISGATYTSRSYVASLQSAIDAAKAASGISG